MGEGGGCAGGVSAVARSLLVSALLLIAGCAPVQQDTSASTVSYLFAQAPQAAAACFARYAEAHSSALIAEIRPPDARGHVEVVVHVKNGVTCATADLRPAGARARGTITLMAISLRGTGELVRSLVEGC